MTKSGQDYAVICTLECVHVTVKNATTTETALSAKPMPPRVWTFLAHATATKTSPGNAATTLAPAHALVTSASDQLTGNARSVLTTLSGTARCASVTHPTATQTTMDAALIKAPATVTAYMAAMDQTLMTVSSALITLFVTTMDIVTVRKPGQTTPPI